VHARGARRDSVRVTLPRAANAAFTRVGGERDEHTLDTSDR
jgi:hypothetical protein